MCGARSLLRVLLSWLLVPVKQRAAKQLQIELGDGGHKSGHMRA